MNSKRSFSVEKMKFRANQGHTKMQVLQNRKSLMMKETPMIKEISPKAYTSELNKTKKKCKYLRVSNRSIPHTRLILSENQSGKESESEPDSDNYQGKLFKYNQMEMEARNQELDLALQKLKCQGRKNYQPSQETKILVLERDEKCKSSQKISKP
mmetsp:Transcript_7307/g.6467  ORF Transcript_7307/g.6467 Transcript_7307/m.6467 type:complete len:155 (+) Transcript_7307:324-788(+)